MVDPSIEVVLWRLTWKLRRDVRGPRRRAIRRGLRGDLRSTAAEVGAREAVRRLGDLNQLAGAYVEAERGLPAEVDYVGGAVAAGFVQLAIILLNGRRVMAFNGLKDLGDFDPWSWTLGFPNARLRLVTLAGDVERDLLLAIRFDRAAYLVIPLVAFVLAARPWRLARSRPRSPLRRGSQAA